VRRADRLFRIIQRLRQRGVHTARALAEELEVSERTVYRNVRDLILSGVPILGEAGVGYALPRGFDLPPLMFTEEEIEALVLGARVVQSWADPELARAASDVLTKVEAVLPPHLRERLLGAAVFAPPYGVPREVAAGLAELRTAIRERRKVCFAYVDKDGAATARTIWPLGLFFWGRTWSLAGYCELREGFRNFRADRVRELCVLEERFDRIDGRRLEDLLRHYQEEEQPRGRSAR
jgi:predicted DNA-binding transcriptional regulator YafY